MLCRRPTRAQPPIVAVVKCTFAAARISFASDRVIQSAADGIVQSVVEAGFVSAGLAGFGVASSPAAAALAAGSATFVSPSDGPSSHALVDDALRALACRSFLAQPEPLKWMLGALMALRTGPLPHSGHVTGGSAWTPCMSSKRWPHAAQS